MKDILFSALASNIKQNNSNKLDLATIILPEGSTTVAVFTQNVFCAAPVIIAKKHIQNDIRALVINSGNANAGTGVASGEAGFDNALRICTMIAEELGIAPEQVLPFSTGVIGEQLPMASFEDFIPTLIQNANNNDLDKVAQAIMTTDTFAKQATKQFIIDGKKVNIIGIAKGSGMIHPNMATMLSFVVTDIVADREELQQALTRSVNKSFNRITVDGDTSTNDACTLSATGVSGVHICDEFYAALDEVMIDLATQIVRDGEGATKFITIDVEADTSEDALKVGYTLATSPLFKTAAFASDANWGRILAAVGRSGVEGLSTQKVSIYLGEVCLIKEGKIASDYQEEQGAAEMAKSDIDIRIIIGKGITERIWTTDLSYDYIKINAEYRT